MHVTFRAHKSAKRGLISTWLSLGTSSFGRLLSSFFACYSHRFNFRASRDLVLGFSFLVESKMRVMIVQSETSCQRWHNYVFKARQKIKDNLRQTFPRRSTGFFIFGSSDRETFLSLSERESSGAKVKDSTELRCPFSEQLLLRVAFSEGDHRTDEEIRMAQKLRA